MDLFIKTPLIQSIHMKSWVKSDKSVYLKLENTQPSASYKLRGLSRLCQHALNNGYKEVVTASGGNAGLAVAFSASKLGLKCHIVVPSMASPKVIDTLKKYGANVEVYGNTSIDVSNRAQELTKMDQDRFFVHPFDDPIIWSGHSTIIDEISEELKEEPGVIITCCGGGGLLCGLIEGMRKHGWTSVPVIAMETTGTASFSACVKAGGKAVTLDGFTGLAVSLSPLRVCDQLVEYYRESKPPILSYLVEDRDAVESCVTFANDHRFVVEVSCGTALSAIYKGLVNQVIDGFDVKQRAIVVIVCGGAAIDLNSLNHWKQEFNLK